MSALLLAALLSALSLLHVYWALGGQAGQSGVVPTVEGRPLFRPSPAATVAVAVALLTAALLVYGCGAGWSPAWLYRLGTGSVGVAFLLRAVGEFRYVGFFKRHRDTRFGLRDTWLYSPLCLAMALLAFATLAL